MKEKTETVIHMMATGGMGGNKMSQSTHQENEQPKDSSEKTKIYQHSLPLFSHSVP